MEGKRKKKVRPMEEENKKQENESCWISRQLIVEYNAESTIYCPGHEWWSYTSTPPYVFMTSCLIN
jgi:hypothetical protein